MIYKTKDGVIHKIIVCVQNDSTLKQFLEGAGHQGSQTQFQPLKENFLLPTHLQPQCPVPLAMMPSAAGALLGRPRGLVDLC